ncbi:MAG TPA: hypothetical protein VFP77_02475, partial [Gemmatimonadaceae bacterium]|nr:hypothetical protein [Gemmatimonadaceae bacterium]
MPELRPASFLPLAFACILTVVPSPASAQKVTRSQNDPRPVARAAPRQGDISIDGKIDEAAWNAATPITELVQAVPDESKEPSQKTEIRILYDE